MYALKPYQFSSLALKSSSLFLCPPKTILPTWELPQDVPSRSSEFAHPDVAIGLTTLAYRYEVRMRRFGEGHRKG